MQITKEQLQKRQISLSQELEQSKANTQAIFGALSDCNFWLEQMDKQEEVPAAEEPKAE